MLGHIQYWRLSKGIFRSRIFYLSAHDGLQAVWGYLSNCLRLSRKLVPTKADAMEEKQANEKNNSENSS